MKKLADAQEVHEAIATMATAIIADHTDTSPLFVALLRGAAPFTSKLMFAISSQAPTFHPELDYMMVVTYGQHRHASQPRIVTDLAPTTSVAGRTIIVLDDVLDKGVTSHFVMTYLRSKGAADVKLAVLINKHTTRQYPIEPDYACLQSEDVWLAGMGLDDVATAPEAYRWRDEVYQLL